LNQEFPEEGELVLATVTKITPYAAYVSLDEYGGLQGFLHISEISTGWVKNIEKVVKEKQKLVLKVIRVNPIRKEVDLSLRQVTEDEKRRKILEVKRQEKALGIIDSVAKKLNLDEDKKQEYISLILEKFESLYDALESLAKKGKRAWEKLDIPEEFINSLEEVVKEKLLPEVKVRGIMKIICPLPNGVEVIKEALNIEGKSEDVKIQITYLGAPKYQLTVSASNYKLAERVLNNIVNRVRDTIVKNQGTFEFLQEK